MDDSFDPDVMALAIGRFVLAFGEIEHLVNDSIERLGGGEARLQHAALLLGPRCRKLLELCEQKSPDRQLLSDANTVFAELRTLRETRRNIVFHAARRIMADTTTMTCYPAVLSHKFEPVSYDDIVRATEQARRIFAKLGGVLFHIHRAVTEA